MWSGLEMTVAILAPSDFIKKEPFGGASGFVENIVRNLSMPTVIYGIGVNGTTAWKPAELDSGVSFVAVDDYRHPSRIPMRLKTFIGYVKSRRRILHSNIDLLYVHSPEIALPFLFGNSRVPLVYHQHGSGNPISLAKHRWARRPLFEKMFNGMLRLIHRRAAWVIAIDDDCVRQAVVNGVGDKTTLLMNAVDTSVFRPDAHLRNVVRSRHRFDDDDCVVLFAGRLEEVKRVDRVVSAMKNFVTSRRGFHLVVAGDGTLRRALEELAEREGVSQRVTFLGAVPHSELPAYYNMADVLALPSEMEGTPMVLLESLSCGTPVVASRVGGIPALVQEGKNGITVPQPTPGTFAEALLQVAQFPADRIEVSATVSHLGTDRFINRLEEIFQRVAGENRHE